MIVWPCDTEDYLVYGSEYGAQSEFLWWIIKSLAVQWTNWYCKMATPNDIRKSLSGNVSKFSHIIYASVCHKEANGKKISNRKSNAKGSNLSSDNKETHTVHMLNDAHTFGIVQLPKWWFPIHTTNTPIINYLLTCKRVKANRSGRVCVDLHWNMYQTLHHLFIPINSLW